VVQCCCNAVNNRGVPQVAESAKTCTIIITTTTTTPPPLKIAMPPPQLHHAPPNQCHVAFVPPTPYHTPTSIAATISTPHKGKGGVIITSLFPSSPTNGPERPVSWPAKYILKASH